MSEHPFAGRRTRMLSMGDVRELLTLEEALDLQRVAFTDLATGRATVSRNAWLRLPEPRRAWLKLLAGHDEPTTGLGVKILARFPENPSGANLGSLVILFDDANGFPLAIMDGVYITALRTGAGAGVATEVLTDDDVTTVGMVGTGVVAWHSLDAIVAVRPSIGSVKVYSRSADRRDRFAERARGELGIDATPVATVEDAVADVDVIVTATNAPEPILMRDQVADGQLVHAMGIRTELDPLLVARSVVVADGIAEATHEGKFSVALAQGVVAEDDLRLQIGDILSGAVPPPPRSGVVLFDSSGVAIQDVVVARRAFEKAEQAGVGTLVDLGLTGTP